MHAKNLGALLATVGIVVVAWFGPYDKLEESKVNLTQVTLSNATGIEKFVIQAEIVDTPESRNKGLMHRTFLPENRGMLFLWSDVPDRKMPKGSGFWMKNTPLPLAIIFIENHQVIHIERHAQPNSLDIIQPIQSNHRTDAVLEVSAKHPLAQSVQIGWTIKFQKK